MKNVIMHKKQNSKTDIFCSEYGINSHFIDSWNPIHSETAHVAAMVIYDVKYDNIQKHNSELEKSNKLQHLYLQESYE